jgi:flagellar biosynthesis protein FlhB
MNSLLNWLGGAIMLIGVAWLIIFVPYYPKREMKKINKRLSEYKEDEQIPDGKVEQLFEESAQDSARRYIHVIIFFVLFAIGVGLVYFS